MQSNKCMLFFNVMVLEYAMFWLLRMSYDFKTCTIGIHGAMHVCLTRDRKVACLINVLFISRYIALVL